jgi:pyruvate formate lyase activating enzyme
VNAEREQLTRIAGHVAAISPDIPWHLLRWTPDYKLTDGDPTSPGALADAVATGHAAGLRHVYVERALGADGRATRCPECGRVVVRREIWAAGSVDLEHGNCPGCGRHVAGRWW